MVEFRQKIEKEKNEILSGVKRFSSLGESMQKFINANSKFNTHKWIPTAKLSKNNLRSISEAVERPQTQNYGKRNASNPFLIKRLMSRNHSVYSKIDNLSSKICFIFDSLSWPFLLARFLLHFLSFLNIPNTVFLGKNCLTTKTIKVRG